MKKAMSFKIGGAQQVKRGKDARDVASIHPLRDIVQSVFKEIQAAGVFLIEKPIMTVKDVALRYGISESTVYAYIHEAKIPHFKPNGRKGPVRFRLKSLLRWEKEREDNVA